MNVFDVSQEILRTPASEFLNAIELPHGERTTSGIEMVFSDQLRAYYQHDQRAMWSRWNPSPRPCFNAKLLTDINAYHDFLARSNAQIECMGEQHPIEYVVLASDKPGVFNLGGDLDLFKNLIAEQDRGKLLRYGRACIDVLYSNYTAFNLPATTISLVQGDALGGGFEAALSGDMIVAEKSARFGFPEILFNLFPGMGAYSFLDRRIGQRATEDLIGSGQLFSAQQMLEKGVIDSVVEDGQGEAGVAALIDRRKRSQNGFAALAQARRRVHKIEFSELLDVVEIWVDSALRLNVRDLKLMHRLVSRQNGLGESQQIH
jgi:Enoyl-CoA hydratase/carnithine racemase